MAPCLPEYPACIPENNDYVVAKVHTAWTYTFCRHWENAKPISLPRIQQHVLRETHVPVTLEMLLYADPQQTKYQKRSWWSNVESVLRCVAGYHRASVAAEHFSSRSLQGDIVEHSITLRRGLPNSVDVKQFLMLLHRSITNRALNLALHKTIDQSLKDDLLVGPGGRRVTENGQQALADMLAQCLDIVDQEYQTLRSDMRQFQC